jgi:hypothetical protein
LTEALHHLTLKDKGKTSLCKASVPPMGILLTQPVIFITIQYLVVKSKCGNLDA